MTFASRTTSTFIVETVAVSDCVPAADWGDPASFPELFPGYRLEPPTTARSSMKHQSWAEQEAREIAKRLGLPTNETNLLALAARLHDEGKQAPRWQRAFKEPRDGHAYAKVGKAIDFELLDGCRHELGSLPYVPASVRGPLMLGRTRYLGGGLFVAKRV